MKMVYRIIIIYCMKKAQKQITSAHTHTHTHTLIHTHTLMSIEFKMTIPQYEQVNHKRIFKKELHSIQ